jgi:hypothetical protein
MDELDLLDWKRRVFELYASIRAARSPYDGWRLWCATRDELFRSHSQTPVAPADRLTFASIPTFPYDPALRVLADVVGTERERREIATSGASPYVFTRFARAEFVLEGRAQSLDVYWLEGYGGGLFLSFTDATTGTETYGGGRYLLDTVKGADLGVEGGKLVLDFNLAYNPSCSYDSRWVCPLAPPENRIDLPVRGGERLPRARRHAASRSPVDADQVVGVSTSSSA